MHAAPLRAIAAASAAVCVAHAAPPADTRPWSEQPYLGLAVRDTPDGTVVAWVYPGPLGGTSFDSAAGVRRGDNLVSLNAEPVDADAFAGRLRAMAVGDTVTLVLRRSPRADPNAAVPTGGPGGDEYTVTVRLASRGDWTGTIGRGLGDRIIPDPPEGEFEQAVLDRARAVGVLDADGGLNALMTNLRGVQEAALDPNALAPVVNTFRRPLSIDAQEHAIDAALRELVAGLGPDITTLREPLAAFCDRVVGINLSRATINKDAHDTPDPLPPAMALVRAMRDDWSISGPDFEPMIRLIAHEGNARDNQLAWNMLLTEKVLAFTRSDVLTQALARGNTPLSRDEMPEKYRDLIDGPVLAIVEPVAGEPVIVIGGDGPNRYDMDRLGVVYDLGGDDRYTWSRSDAAARSAVVVIDLAGNDTYESTADFAGPATGVFGTSIIDDLAGNDVYRSTGQFSIGAGLFGIGLLIDRAGDDRYENLGPDSGWSMGVGFYGVGLVIDRAGSDVYHAEKLSQGVGGPRGFGAILDGAGNDLYQANGPSFGSAYATPGVYLGMSQGFGFGVRGHAAGGVGAIYDDAGNDQYIAGEFSQGGGYYFGLGILHDRSGNDLYHGNRYGQAFAAHQAAGILVDDAGDDTYWSMTAASQSGVWDQSVTMLVDRAGNDAYRCDGLGLGAASMQAIGLFFDLGGDDRYSANAGAVLGRSGGDSYHYDADRVFSFSAFFDLGSGRDAYPAGQENNTARSTGQRDEAHPQNSSLHGLFVDE